MSASTGSRPAWTIACTAPQNVMVEVSTFEPEGSSRARRDSSIAVVQEATATACGALTHSPNSRSNSTTSGPVVTQPDFRTLATDFWAAAVISVVANGMRAAGNGVRCAVLMGGAP